MQHFSEEQIKKISQSVVSWKGFEWMPGMVPTGEDFPSRVLSDRLTYVSHIGSLDSEYSVKVEHSEIECSVFYPVMESGGPDNFPAWGWPTKTSGWLPDVTDPATLGCIQHLFHEQGLLPKEEALSILKISSILEVEL